MTEHLATCMYNNIDQVTTNRAVINHHQVIRETGACGIVYLLFIPLILNVLGICSL